MAALVGALAGPGKPAVGTVMGARCVACRTCELADDVAHAQPLPRAVASWDRSAAHLRKELHGQRCAATAASVLRHHHVIDKSSTVASDWRPRIAVRWQLLAPCAACRTHAAPMLPRRHILCVRPCGNRQQQEAERATHSALAAGYRLQRSMMAPSMCVVQVPGVLARRTQYAVASGDHTNVRKQYHWCDGQTSISSTQSYTSRQLLFARLNWM